MCDFMQYEIGQELQDSMGVSIKPLMAIRRIQIPQYETKLLEMMDEKSNEAGEETDAE